MKSFYLAGLKYQSTVDYLTHIRSTDILLVLRESENTIDPDALAVYYKGIKLGYIPRQMSESLRKEVNKYGSAHLKIIQFFPDRPSWKKFKVLPLSRKAS